MPFLWLALHGCSSPQSVPVRVELQLREGSLVLEGSGTAAHEHVSFEVGDDDFTVQVFVPTPEKHQDVSAPVDSIVTVIGPEGPSSPTGVLWEPYGEHHYTGGAFASAEADWRWFTVKVGKVEERTYRCVSNNAIFCSDHTVEVHDHLTEMEDIAGTGGCDVRYFLEGTCADIAAGGCIGSEGALFLLPGACGTEYWSEDACDVGDGCP